MGIFEYAITFSTNDADHFYWYTFRGGMGLSNKMGRRLTLVRLDGKGGVEIFSKRIEPRNNRFPEIVVKFFADSYLSFRWRNRLFWWQPAELAARPGWGAPKKYDVSLIFVMFDMFYDEGKDIRLLPFKEHYARLG